MQADLQAALDLGLHPVRRRGRGGRIDEVLRDAAAGTLKPIYNFMNDLPGARSGADALSCRARSSARTVDHHAQLRCRTRLSVPVLVLHHHQRAGPQVAPPLARRRRATDPRSTGRRASAASSSPTTISPATRTGKRSSIASSSCASATRSTCGCIIQVDTLCHKIPNFIEKATRAGVTRVFIGLENINPDQPDGGEEAAEQDHRVPQDAARLEAGRHLTYAGYILGFPGDTPESIRATSRSSRRSCRSTSWSSSSSRRCPARRTTRCCRQKGAWMDPDVQRQSRRIPTQDTFVA